MDFDSVRSRGWYSREGGVAPFVVPLTNPPPPVRGHQAVVREWLGLAEGSSSVRVLELFETGFQRVWQRAQPTLGEVTLGAILDRVLYTATERFSLLGTLGIRNGSLDFSSLRGGIDDLPADELVQAAGFVLAEFLTVLGHLTAEILTPALHAELSAARLAGGPKIRARRTKT